MTYTYAVLVVSAEVYDEIKGLMEGADYGHAFDENSEHGTLIDMHGIAIARGAPASAALDVEEKVAEVLLDQAGEILDGIAKKFDEAAELTGRNPEFATYKRGVLGAIRALPPGAEFTVGEFAAAHGFKKSTVRTSVSVLSHRGVVSRVGGGRWRRCHDPLPPGGKC